MTMSIGMLNGLNSLLAINNQMSNLQMQVTTGKRINNASDGLNAFLTARSYTQRADRLQSVNDTLGSHLQTVKASQLALDSIRKTITNTLDTLKAASLTQEAATATRATDTATDSTTLTQVDLKFTAVTNAGAIVNGNTLAINRDTALTKPDAAAATTKLQIGGQNLEKGQIFKINNTYIRISDNDTTTTDGVTTFNDKPAAGTAEDGTTQGTAYYVRTVGELIDKIESALNSRVDNVRGLANNYNGKDLIISAPGALTFQQVAGKSVYLDQMFKGGRAAGVKGTFTSDDQDLTTAVPNGSNTPYDTMTLRSKDHTITAGTPKQDADAKRAAAAQSYKAAIEQVNQMLRGAAVAGVNLLAGDKLTVALDEKGNSTQFQLLDGNGSPLTFDAAGLGIVNKGTNKPTDLDQSFATNDDLDPNNAGKTLKTGLNAAIDKLTNALSLLTLGDTQVAQMQSGLQDRVDFNKSMISMFGDTVNSLTSVDMTAVTAQYSALQIQQGFAQTMLANTKQSDQSIMQLLR